VTVICEGAAAGLLSSGRINAVITGADRIALNGDSANKVGTLSLAVLCEKYGIPFYIAAPWSTFDLSLADGSGVPIEERPQEEVLNFAGLRAAPEGVRAYNPAFDITPHSAITAIITETCVIELPDEAKISTAAHEAGVLPQR
jgi:methylthioribose-1-phosphate isomerase